MPKRESGRKYITVLKVLANLSHEWAGCDNVRVHVTKPFAVAALMQPVKRLPVLNHAVFRHH